MLLHCFFSSIEDWKSTIQQGRVVGGAKKHSVDQDYKITLQSLSTCVRFCFILKNVHYPTLCDFSCLYLTLLDVYLE